MGIFPCKLSDGVSTEKFTPQAISQSSSGSLGFQVGSNASRVQSFPTSVPFINKVQFCAIATGSNHVIALTVDGKVYTWGAGEAGMRECV